MNLFQTLRSMLSKKKKEYDTYREISRLDSLTTRSITQHNGRFRLADNSVIWIPKGAYMEWGRNLESVDQETRFMTEEKYFHKENYPWIETKAKKTKSSKKQSD